MPLIPPMKGIICFTRLTNIIISHTEFLWNNVVSISSCFPKNMLSTAFKSLFLWDGLHHKDSSRKGSSKCSSLHRSQAWPLLCLTHEISGDKLYVVSWQEPLQLCGLTLTSPELLNSRSPQVECLLSVCSCNRSFPGRRPLQQITAHLGDSTTTYHMWLLLDFRVDATVEGELTLKVPVSSTSKECVCVWGGGH